jgi:hypothetical protein
MTTTEATNNITATMISSRALSKTCQPSNKLANQIHLSMLEKLSWKVLEYLKTLSVFEGIKNRI